MRFYQPNKEPTGERQNWNEAITKRLGAHGLRLANPLWFNSGDGLDQECTQENTTLILNTALPDADLLTIYDHRDEGNYAFWRDSISNFDQLEQSLMMSGGAFLQKTLYPQKKILELWQKKRGLIVNDEAIQALLGGNENAQ